MQNYNFSNRSRIYSPDSAEGNGRYLTDGFGREVLNHKPSLPVPVNPELSPLRVRNDRMADILKQMFPEHRFDTSHVNSAGSNCEGGL